MKKNLHPTVRQVVFKDVSCDFSFLGTSTMDSTETIKWEDGKNYPLIKVEISSASHPFFTGKRRVLDTCSELITSGTLLDYIVIFS